MTTNFVWDDEAHTLVRLQKLLKNEPRITGHIMWTHRFGDHRWVWAVLCASGSGRLAATGVETTEDNAKTAAQYAAKQQDATHVDTAPR